MTTPSHAAPWTVRRFLAQFTPATRQPRVDILTGREAVARALYFEAVGGSKLDMLEYDRNPYIRGAWLIEADRRIAAAPSIPDLLVLRHWGYAVTEWNDLSALVKADKREHYYQARGL